MLPKRRFWGPIKHSGTYFQSTFQMKVAQMSTHVCEKCFENTFPNIFSAFQNLRLVSIKVSKNTNPFVVDTLFDEWFEMEIV